MPDVKVEWKLEQQMPDPDTGEKLRPEVAEYLHQSAERKGPYRSLGDVKRELGLSPEENQASHAHA